MITLKVIRAFLLYIFIGNSPLNHYSFFDPTKVRKIMRGIKFNDADVIL